VPDLTELDAAAQEAADVLENAAPMEEADVTGLATDLTLKADAVVRLLRRHLHTWEELHEKLLSWTPELAAPQRNDFDPCDYEGSTEAAEDAFEAALETWITQTEEELKCVLGEVDIERTEYA
jgi:hypothetical protein